MTNAGELIRMKFKKSSSGLKRTEAEMRNNGELPAIEGKAPLTVDGYKLIAEVALNEKSTFSWAYTLLAWNLISRCANIASMKYEHICWQHDCLVVVFPKTKTDQEGTSNLARHVYANPFDPLICPILALAVHFFSGGPELSGQSIAVFKGTCPSARFNAWLTLMWKRLSEVKKNNSGLTAVDGGVGSHSFRLGTK